MAMGPVISSSVTFVSHTCPWPVSTTLLSWTPWDWVGLYMLNLLCRRLARLRPYDEMVPYIGSVIEIAAIVSSLL